MRNRLLTALGTAFVLAMAATPMSASAVVPGGNGPIVFTSTRDGNAEIYRMDANGASQTRLTNAAGADTDAVWSQDRTKIAFVSNRDGNAEIYTMGPNGQDPTRITNHAGADTDPVFSPDGSVIAFASDRDGDREIYTVSLSDDSITKLTDNAVQDFGPDYNGAGTKIVFQRFTPGVGTGTGDEIFTMNADGSSQTNVTNNAATISDVDPSFSASGNEIAFASNRDGDYEIFRMGVSGASPTQLTNNTTADIEPGFSPDGNQIAFTTARTGNNEVYSMTRTGASPTDLSNNAASDSEPNYQALDIFPPDTTITAGPADGTTITTRTPSFEFTSTEAGSTFECKVDAGAFASCSSPFTTASLADGAHTVSVRATDPSGNPDPTPAARSFSVDATNPETTIDSGPADGSTINVNSADFEFSADETATFECSLDGAAFAACTSPQSYTGLTEDSHTFEVRATDAFGNVDLTPASRTFTVDLANPETTIDSGPADGGLTNDATPEFTFSSGEPGTFECSEDGAAFAACASPYTTSTLSDGPHTFAVRAIDAGGNVDPTPASHAFTVDTTSPDTAIDSGPAEASTVGDEQVSFDFSSADADTGSFECSLDGAPFAACTSPYNSPNLDDGPHTFEVRAVDNAGNPDPSPASRSFTVDAPPRTSITTGPADASRVNVPTPTFEFTSSEPGSDFECKVDADAFAACTSPFATSTLADGDHTFSVRAVETGGGRPDPTPATRAFTVDTAAPDTTIGSGPAEGSTVNNPTPSLTFSSSEPGSTFQCQVDGGGYSSCTSPFTTSALSDGPHTVDVRATDIAGNTDATPATRSFTVDATAPDTTIDSGPADGSSINATTPSFAFSSPDNTATFECSADGAVFTACTSPVTTPSLSDGSHTFAVRAVDPVGNADATPASRTFTVDTIAPETTILTGPGPHTSEASPSLTFDSSQTSSTFECSVDGGAFTACTSPFTTPALSDGSHTVTVRATDPAGNTDSTPASRTFTVDTADPETTIDTGPADGSSVLQAAVTIAFSSSETGSTFECSLDGGAFTACTSPSFFTFDDGPHTFSVQAIDQAGNTDPTPATRSFTVDQPPNTAITAGPADGSTIADSTPEFSFDSNEPSAVFECRIDSAAFVACTSPFTTAALADGSHTFTVRAVEPSGLTRPDDSPASRTFTVDTTGPDTSITSGPADGSSTSTPTPSFAFTSPEGTATFECSEDGAAFTACTSPQTTATLGDGPHTFAVRAVDTLGNADATPASRSFTVDTGAPDTTIDTGPADASTIHARTADFTYSSDEPGVTFECSLDGGAFASCPNTGKSLADLTDGSHTFSVRAVDAAANIDATPASRTFTVDAAPDTTIDSGPADGSTTSDSTPTFVFSSEDNAATFECTIDGSAFASCTSPTTPGQLDDGSHTFQVRATDASGQTDPTPASSTFTVDTDAPDTSITSGPAAGARVGTATPEFSFTSPLGSATFECSVDGAAYAACTSPDTLSTLTEGAHTFSVRALDGPGNADPTPATRSFTVDLTAPTAAISSGPTGLTADSTPSFTFSSDPDATFQCAIDAGAFAACSSPFTPTSLSDGAHTFSVRATDEAGNAQASATTRSFTVDATAPSVAITEGPAGGSTVSSGSQSFTFTSADSGATFECSLDGGDFAACTSPFATSALSDGVHSVSVRAVDAAGNRSAADSRTFTVDANGLGNPPASPVKPSITTLRDPIKVPNSRKAKLATIRCPEGSCTVGVPKKVQIKIGKKSYKASLAVPKRISAGGTAQITLKVSKQVLAALAAEGPGRLMPFTVNVSSSNGTTAKNRNGWDVKSGTKA